MSCVHFPCLQNNDFSFETYEAFYNSLLNLVIIKKVGIPYEEARFGHDFRLIGLHTCILLFWDFDYIVIFLDI